MYLVSEAFLTAVQENTRSFYWTGRITTKAGAVYEFGNEDIVKGSAYISSQCCRSAEIEIGTVYAAELGVTLFSEIDRYTLEELRSKLLNYKVALQPNKHIEIWFRLCNTFIDKFQGGVRNLFLNNEKNNGSTCSIIDEMYGSRRSEKLTARPAFHLPDIERKSFVSM